MDGQNLTTTKADIDDTFLDLFAAVLIKAGGHIDLTAEEWNAQSDRSYRFECRDLGTGKFRVQVIWTGVH